MTTRLIWILPLVLLGCKEDKWKNYSPQDRIDIERGCAILDPVQFKAKITQVERYNYHGKQHPKWIHAEVFSSQESSFLEQAKEFQPRRWFDFSGWPAIKLVGEHGLVAFFPPGDTLVKESGACAFSNTKRKGETISLYFPYRD